MPEALIVRERPRRRHAPSNSSLRWVEEPRLIVCHYMKGWFVLDIISILPFDLASLKDPDEDPDAESSSSDLSVLKLVRIIRLLRLIKLVRLVRGARILKRWESKLAINYSTLTLWQCLIGLLLSAHWFACVWAMQVSGFHTPCDACGSASTYARTRTRPLRRSAAHQTSLGGGVYLLTPFSSCAQVSLAHETPVDSWMGYYGYCWDVGKSAATSLERVVVDGPGAADFECAEPGMRYSASVYFAVMTITSIGYGDITPRPQLASEQIMATLLMLVASMLWAYIIGTFCGMIATMNPAQANFRNTIDDLNRFMELQDLAPEMRQRLREYFHETKHLQIAMANRKLLSKMSPALAGEVAVQTSEKYIKRIWYLKGVDSGFMAQLAMRLEPMVFAPSELVPVGKMYICHRGIALYGGKIMTAGYVEANLPTLTLTLPSPSPDPNPNPDPDPNPRQARVGRGHDPRVAPPDQGLLGPRDELPRVLLHLQGRPALGRRQLPRHAAAHPRVRHQAFQPAYMHMHMHMHMQCICNVEYGIRNAYPMYMHQVRHQALFHPRGHSARQGDEGEGEPRRRQSQSRRL